MGQRRGSSSGGRRTARREAPHHRWARPFAEVVRRWIPSLVLLLFGLWGLGQIGAPRIWVLPVAAGIAWAAAPLAAALARRAGLIVRPGGRSMHVGCVPLLGGLALAVPFCGLLFLLGDPREQLLAVTGLFIFVVGLADDRFGLAAKQKLFAQVVAALLLTHGGFGIETIYLPPWGSIHLSVWALPVFIGWVVLVTNALNLADGMDGLAVGLAAVALPALLVTGSSCLACLALAGAALGFWGHNLPPARLFLGDAGSLLLGLGLAVTIIDAQGGLHLPIALAALALPLGDLAFCSVRRAVRGKPIFAADSGHLHHRFLSTAGDSGRALAWLLGFAGAQILVVLVAPNVWGMVGLALWWAALLAFVLQTRRGPLAQTWRNRRAFRAYHLARRYASGHLRMARSREDVGRTLRHVCDDLDLAALRVRDLEIPGAEKDPEAEGVAIDCGDSVATWWARSRLTDPVLAEERHAIVCDLIRASDRRLARIEKRARLEAERRARREHPRHVLPLPLSPVPAESHHNTSPGEGA